MVKLQMLISFILGQKYAVRSWTIRVKPVFEIMPEDFLNFAKSDLKKCTKKSIVNALSNIKRAIDSQIDLILFSISYYNKSKKGNWNFPNKVDFINSLGIVSPKVIKEINKTRNLLEHEYKYPTVEKVQIALDIAELFIHATERITDTVTSCFIWDLSGNKKLAERRGHVMYDELVMQYDTQKRCFEIGLSGLREFTIKENASEFFELLKKYLELTKSS